MCHRRLKVVAFDAGHVDAEIEGGGRDEEEDHEEALPQFGFCAVHLDRHRIPASAREADRIAPEAEGEDDGGDVPEYEEHDTYHRRGGRKVHERLVEAHAEGVVDVPADVECEGHTRVLVRPVAVRLHAGGGERVELELLLAARVMLHEGGHLRGHLRQPFTRENLELRLAPILKAAAVGDIDKVDPRVVGGPSLHGAHDAVVDLLAGHVLDGIGHGGEEEVLRKLGHDLVAEVG
mmetsp:Transcript_24008/g.74781  ORF Transcript_24008/g.74781 Transcript_24008/m.74781 type:complete len:235 (-) Transcript_24008:223-927(-)